MISRKKSPDFPFPDRSLLETFAKTSAENLLAFDINFMQNPAQVEAYIRRCLKSLSPV